MSETNLPTGHLMDRRHLLASAFGLACLRPATLLADEKPACWVKSAKNPMLSLGRGEDFDRENIMSPAIVKEGDRYLLFYAGGPSGPRTKEDYINYQLGLALSTDGETWTKRGKPLLPLGERDNFHTTPALLRSPAGGLHKIDGLWHMLYCGNRADDIEHATSRDGLTWEKDPRSPVYKAAYSPSVLQVGNEVRLYYIHKPPPGAKEPGWQIHLATGKDLHSLKAHPANPMLKLSQAWEKAHLFYPYVLQEGTTWVMFYAAYWSERPNSTAIGMATSTDGVAWTKHRANPMLTPTPGSRYDSNYTSAQSVIRDGDHYKLYYGSRINQIHKYFAIGLATNHGPLVVK